MPSKTKAVIWDMDGVIADTGAYHCKSWQYVFRKRGVDFTEEDFRHIFGKRNDAIIRGELGQSLNQNELDTIAAEKEENFCKQVEQDNIRPFPGAVELIQDLTEHGFAIAIASSAPAGNINLILNKLGVQHKFHAVVFGREVTEGKPSPQVFLLAARKLGVEPANCVVIEDAVAGVTGAKRAGMFCVAVTNTHPPESLSEADVVVSTLEEIGAGFMERLLSGQSQVKISKGVKMEKSLVLIKPDAMTRNLGCTILSRIESRGLKLVALKMLHVSRELAHKHYAVHAGKPFFNDLIDYITSTPIVAAVFQGENAVELIRNTMGATDPAKSATGTIRRDFGVDIQRNAVHGSDSVENAKKEISLYFSEAEIFG